MVTEADLDEMALLLHGVPFMDLERLKKLDVVCEILKRILPEGSKVTVPDGDTIQVEVPRII